jgi:hypothetical protein
MLPADCSYTPSLGPNSRCCGAADRDKREREIFAFKCSSVRVSHFEERRDRNSEGDWLGRNWSSARDRQLRPKEQHRRGEDGHGPFGLIQLAMPFRVDNEL